MAKPKILRDIVVSTCVLLLLFNLVSSDACRHPCFCNKAKTSFNCEGKQLESVPLGIPATVEKIYLDHNHISLISQTDFCNLLYLQELYLQNNKITSLRTDTFNGKCTPNLRVLHLENNLIANIEANAFRNMSVLNSTQLQNNQISTIDRMAFNEISSLLSLNLGGNYLKKIPPLIPIPSLETLVLEANSISNGTFPVEFDHMSALTTIGLSNNKLTELTNKTFEHLQNSPLRKLEIARNDISTISKGAFKPLSRLQSLKLGWNPLTAANLETGLIGLQNSQLRSLNIFNITLGGSLPSSTFHILSKTNLTTLLMANNKINQIPNNGFDVLKNLELLDLSSCSIREVPNKAFSGLVSLTNLKLNNNELKVVPKNLPKSLSLLYLNGNQINEIQNFAFQNLSNLKRLYLGNNRIGTLFENAFSGLVSLQILHLVANNISTLPGRIFAAFGRLTSLELNKNRLKLISKSTDTFSSMTSLKYLSLADNGLTTFPMVVFNQLRSLMYIHLQNNQMGYLIASDVSGTIFRGFHKLQILDLSNNHITHLPGPLLQDLQSLQDLKMQNNLISGWDGNFFAKTKSLRTLDLSYNMIAIIKETSVKDWTKLKSLNLAKNAFDCSCDLRWFRDWINETKIVLENVGSYKCSTPPEWNGKYLLTFDRTKINCLWFNLAFVISISVASAILVLLVCFILYRKRWWILYKFYRLKKLCCSSQNKGQKGYEEIPGGDRLYHGYISYAEEDYQWVLKHLLPDIDAGELEHPFNGEFRLFFDERDAIPGSTFMSNISNNMERSQKVIIVLTKNYLSKAKHKFEIELAFELWKVDNIIDDIIVIKVEGVSMELIPKSLHKRIAKQEFILWEDNEHAIQLFKEKLKEALKETPKPKHVEV